MKKQIYIFICITALTSGLQASLPVQYWNDNVKKPKSSITKPLSMRQKCSQTIAMIKERKTVNLEKSIPLLMEVLTKEIHTMPEAIPTQIEKNEISNSDNDFSSFLEPIKTGPSLEIFKRIIDKEPLLQQQNLSLHKARGCPHLCFSTAGTNSNKVAITYHYQVTYDAFKLFVIHHELQHQLNGDANIRNRIATVNNESALIYLAQTRYVRSILKPHIKNNQGKNLQTILKENGPSLEEVSRYQEYRADIKALHSIHCACCIKEIAQSCTKKPGYNANGYLRQWQFEPRIKELQKKGTICQHHHENDEKIDISITDSSTLIKRMNIIQK